MGTVTSLNGGVVMSSILTSLTKTVPARPTTVSPGTCHDAEHERAVVGVLVGDDRALLRDGSVDGDDVAGAGISP